jgi:hypothetical protein
MSKAFEWQEKSYKRLTRLYTLIFSLKINNSQRLVTIKIWPTNLNMITKIENSTVVFRNVPVVSWRSVRCVVIFRCLSGVVNRDRAIVRSFGVPGRNSVSSGIILRCLGSVVLRGLGVVARCSVGCGVVNWSLGVVFRFNVVRRSSRRVVSRGCVIVGRLSCSCVTWGRVTLRGFGVVARGSISCGVILWSLGGVVLGWLGEVFSRFGGVISWSLGVVAKNWVILGSRGV